MLINYQIRHVEVPLFLVSFLSNAHNELAQSDRNIYVFRSTRRWIAEHRSWKLINY